MGIPLDTEAKIRLYHKFLCPAQRRTEQRACFSPVVSVPGDSGSELPVLWIELSVVPAVLKSVSVVSPSLTVVIGSVVEVLVVVVVLSTYKRS